jgi:hypothetical protein
VTRNRPTVRCMGCGGAGGGGDKDMPAGKHRPAMTCDELPGLKGYSCVEREAPLTQDVYPPFHPFPHP